uniref:Uncharacterized protein n=1 Tax=Amphimedon queenslandica TaxID=400682 RepID=A0A1X7SF26_AMPQE
DTEETQNCTVSEGVFDNDTEETQSATVCEGVVGIGKGNSKKTHVSVSINYPSGKRNIPITSPWRQKAVKSLTRGSYRALLTSLQASTVALERVLKDITKTIKEEMKLICSDDHDSIIRD